MPTWPVTLPTQPNGDFSETPPDLLLRSEMDAGPDKVRKRYTAGVREFEVEYKFLPEQMDIWEAFYEDDLDDGANSFTWPHPRKASTNITVRLKGVPTYKHLGGGVYRMNMTMEQLP